VELGAGSALPSLLAATLPKRRHASLVVVTDYPDPSIMNTLEENVERARQQRGRPHPTVEGGATEESEEGEGERCRIECAGYEWGSDVSQLLLSVRNVRRCVRRIDIYFSLLPFPIPESLQ
jgi:nicotinamide N-methyltransferase